MNAPRIHRRAPSTVLSGIIFAGILSLLAAVLSEAAADPVAAALQSMAQAAGAPIESSRSPLTGLVTFMATSAAPIALSLPVTADPANRAREFLSAHGRAFGIADVADVAHSRSYAPDEVGMEHVRFQQLYGGLPVTGGELTVHLRGAGVVAVNAKTLDVTEKIATTPAIGAAEALVKAEGFIAKHFGISSAVFSPPRLEVFNRGMLEGSPAPTRLAWFIEAKRVDLRQFIWIDAKSGMRLLDFSQLTDALSRSVYTANGGSALPGTLVRSEGGPPTADLDVNTAYDFAGDTYNYYLIQHGRDSYDGAGAPIIATVHYCPTNNNCNYSNAFWNGTQMVYGNGFPRADDVDAHELTHAVTEHSARLFYYMQSGALNESYSDIFGETVDLMNGHGNDAPSVRWLMGEDIPRIGAFRNMMNPNAFNDPGKMSDAAQFVCQTPGDDKGGVHTNSGVPNHAYALMVDGGTYNGFTIAGLGLVKAGKIQYRNLTTYLLSASDFLDSYNGLKRSCADLIGTVGITSSDCIEVAKALDAVEMASPWPCAPTQPGVPPLCPANQTPSYLFFDDLENPASGNWAITTLTGTTHWFYPPPSDFVFATSGTRNFWGYDAPVVGDSVIAMTRSVAIPAGGAALQFNHSFGFENPAYDGGVIEYSTNGGASWSDAGNLITAGAAYRGAISSRFGNPLAGRNAFIGESFGYTASQLNLTSLAGQNVRFRFRLGTDISDDDKGWFIDDIAIYQCGGTPPPSSSLLPGFPADYDGDGKIDIAVYRPSTGTWFIINSATSSVTAQQWGSPGDIPVPGDYDGDGKDDITAYRPSNAMWFIIQSSNGAVRTQQWGASGDVPMPGDYDGDGKTDIAVYRPSTGVWFIINSSTGGVRSQQWGAPSDRPVPGDYDGDHRTDIAVYRPSTGVWFIINSSTGGGTAQQWGAAGDIPVPGDYDGDGKTDIAVYRPSTGVWFIINSSTGGGTAQQWGAAGDVPVPGDYDGDGKTDIAFYRPSTGVWFIIRSSTGSVQQQQWGAGGDQPLPEWF